MPGWRRVLTILLIVVGPGCIIYFLAKNLKNKFIELPYLGQTEYISNEQGEVIDSINFSVPDFELTRFDGVPINNDSIAGKFIVLTTLQQACPELDSCGMGIYLFNQLFFKKLIKNQKNYGNVKVLSVLTDLDGNAIPGGPNDYLKEAMSEFDPSIWWMTYGDPTPLFSWEYYDMNFMDHPATPDNGEVGSFAWINSIVLLDDKGHVRGVSGAKKDSDIRNFFDMLKLLKKEDFDRKWEEEHKN